LVPILARGFATADFFEKIKNGGFLSVRFFTG
jgi:hypothetical protein